MYVDFAQTFFLKSLFFYFNCSYHYTFWSGGDTFNRCELLCNFIITKLTLNKEIQFNSIFGFNSFKNYGHKMWRVFKFFLSQRQLAVINQHRCYYCVVWIKVSSISLSTFHKIKDKVVSPVQLPLFCTLIHKLLFQWSSVY